jgi:hypothetical protein
MNEAYENVRGVMNPTIHEDVERGKCQRLIVNLCKKLDHDVKELIEHHIVKFKGRNPTEEEDASIRFMVSYMLEEGNDE